MFQQVLKRMLSFAMAAAMTAGLIHFIGGGKTVFAEDASPYAVPHNVGVFKNGTWNDGELDHSLVYFGMAENLTGMMATAWRLLEIREDVGGAQEALVLSDARIDVLKDFGNNELDWGNGLSWEDSNLRNLFGQWYDYGDDVYGYSRFHMTPEIKSLVKTTETDPGVFDNFFFLSYGEAVNYDGTITPSITLPTQDGKPFWTRTEADAGNVYSFSPLFDNTNRVSLKTSTQSQTGARPAAVLDLSDIVFMYKITENPEASNEIAPPTGFAPNQNGREYIASGTYQGVYHSVYMPAVINDNYTQTGLKYNNTDITGTLIADEGDEIDLTLDDAAFDSTEFGPWVQYGKMAYKIVDIEGNIVANGLGKNASDGDDNFYKQLTIDTTGLDGGQYDVLVWSEFPARGIEDYNFWVNYYVINTTEPDHFKLQIGASGESLVQPSAINGVVRPVAGEIASLSIFGGTGFDAVLEWTGMTSGETFAHDTAYTAMITLTAKEGYTFQNDGEYADSATIESFSVNGKLPVWVSNNGETLVFSVSFQTSPALIPNLGVFKNGTWDSGEFNHSLIYFGMAENLTGVMATAWRFLEIKEASDGKKEALVLSDARIDVLKDFDNSEFDWGDGLTWAESNMRTLFNRWYELGDDVDGFNKFQITPQIKSLIKTTETETGVFDRFFFLSHDEAINYDGTITPSITLSNQDGKPFWTRTEADEESVYSFSPLFDNTDRTSLKTTTQSQTGARPAAALDLSNIVFMYKIMEEPEASDEIAPPTGFAPGSNGRTYLASGIYEDIYHSIYMPAIINENYTQTGFKLNGAIVEDTITADEGDGLNVSIDSAVFNNTEFGPWVQYGKMAYKIVDNEGNIVANGKGKNAGDPGPGENDYHKELTIDTTGLDDGLYSVLVWSEYPARGIENYSFWVNYYVLYATVPDHFRLQIGEISVGLNTDIDKDGQVDSKDLAVLLDNYGKSGSDIGEAAADIDGDTQVDSGDLSMLLEDYGKSGGQSPA